MELASDKPFRREWGYRLYAALLERAPQEFGEQLHMDAVTPVSQFVYQNKEKKLIWTVSLLGEESERVLGPVLEQAESWKLLRDDALLKVVNREVSRIRDVEELLQMAAVYNSPHKLEICTPTAFKQQGKYINLPTTHLLVQNLLRKWNGCIKDCPIEDTDGQGTEALAHGLRLRNFKIQDRMYRLKKAEIDGFVGIMNVENNLSGFHRQLADALLFFSDYAGLGIKTALGMGGIRHMEISERRNKGETDGK